MDQAPEGQLDVLERAEDVGVVHLQVVHDRHLGQVVDELAPLVEERRVVLVALQDEPGGVGESGSLSEVGRDAADQEGGVEAGVLEHPGQQGGGGGLAVGAGHHEGVLPADEALLEELRQRAVAEPVVEDVLRLGVAPGDGVADHHEVRLVGEVRLRIAGLRYDSARGEERRHRGIDDILVRSCDDEPAFAEGDGDAGHGGAADADEVDAPEICEHGPSFDGMGKDQSQNTAGVPAD